MLLTWEKADATAPTYTVLRSETPEEGYEIIARYVEDTAFVDNKAEEGKTYYYTVKDCGCFDEYFPGILDRKRKRSPDGCPLRTL